MTIPEAQAKYDTWPLNILQRIHKYSRIMNNVFGLL